MNSESKSRAKVRARWACKKKSIMMFPCFFPKNFSPTFCFYFWVHHFIYMGVSQNTGTPKWMVYNGKPYWNRWFGGTTIFRNIHIYICICIYIFIIYTWNPNDPCFDWKLYIYIISSIYIEFFCTSEVGSSNAVSMKLFSVPLMRLQLHCRCRRWRPPVAFRLNIATCGERNSSDLNVYPSIYLSIHPSIYLSS